MAESEEEGTNEYCEQEDANTPSLEKGSPVGCSIEDSDVSCSAELDAIVRDAQQLDEAKQSPERSKFGWAEEPSHQDLEEIIEATSGNRHHCQEDS